MKRFVLKKSKIKHLGASASALLIAAATLFGAQPANATTCTYGTLFASLGSGVLYKYQPDGTQIGNGVQLTNVYFDLAFDSTNGTFYGIRSNGQIDVVNLDTGAVIRSVQARSGFYNSGSVLPGGMIAAANGSMIVYINPANGTTTDYYDMNLIEDENGQTYTGWSSAGDFITLSDGSLILLLNNNNVQVASTGTLVVKVTNGIGQILGTVPVSWGGARVGSDLFLAGADGQLRKITNLPTSPGRGAISTTTIATSQSGGYYGAAGTEDSEAAACSTVSINGYVAGVDAFSAVDPTAPAAAGTAPAPSPNPSSSPSPNLSQNNSSSLAVTGSQNPILPLLLGFGALVTGITAVSYRHRKH